MESYFSVNKNFLFETVLFNLNMLLIQFNLDFLGIVVFVIGLLLNNYDVFDGKLPSVIFVVTILLALLTAMAIGRQPVQEIDLSFKVRQKCLYFSSSKFIDYNWMA